MKKVKNILITVASMVFLMFVSLVFAETNNLSDPNKGVVVSKNEAGFSIKLATGTQNKVKWYLKEFDSNLIEPVKRDVKTSTGKGSQSYEQWFFRVKPIAFRVPCITSITLMSAQVGSAQGIQASTFRVVTR
ncbi:MAG: hypothetical protein WCW01_02100 [Gammaproteobacteria bacterium]